MAAGPPAALETAGTLVRPARPIDLRLTLGVLAHGRSDPTMRTGGSVVERATRTPVGPAAMRLAQRTGGEIDVVAWGQGATWVVERAPALVGALDDDSGFLPTHPLLAELHRRRPGLRFCRTEAVFEAVISAVLRQKVTSVDAMRTWARLARALGEPAPGALGLLLPPSPSALARTPPWTFHRAGLEARRTATLRRAALVAGRLEEAVTMAPDAASERLQAVAGIGAWTAAEVAMTALGDPDAVPVGDFHIPNTVCWALAGEARGDDERMLELLEPYRGHRGRVIRLLHLGGVHAPRRGPRLAPRDISRL